MIIIVIIIDVVVAVSVDLIIYFIKDCLPYLFHGFRNKYFNKISLDNMLYFRNKLHKFWEIECFFDKFTMKNNLQNKM